MAYFWNSLLQPILDEHELPKQKQTAELKNSEVVPSELLRSEPTEKAFQPIYVTRKPKITVEVPVIDVSELNKYSIQNECTPVHSQFNSPRVSVDKLDIFSTPNTHNVVNNGVFNNSVVNGGVRENLAHTSLPDREYVQDNIQNRLSELQHKFDIIVNEFNRIQQQMTNLTEDLSNLYVDSC
jgi:hypothetical protein